MSSAAELMALADRCEREEPNALLDAAIAAQMGVELSQTTRIYGAPAEVLGPNHFCEVTRYTTSLDAAVTLVAFGGYSVMTHGPLGGKRPDEEIGPTAYVAGTEGRAKTPALALCAAALRARAAVECSSDGKAQP